MAVPDDSLDVRDADRWEGMHGMDALLGLAFLTIFVYSALNIVYPFGKFGLTSRRRAAAVTAISLVPR